MSVGARTELENLIDELHNEAATALAQLAYEREHFPWRNDVKPGNVYEKRAQVALQAAAHLVEAL